MRFALAPKLALLALGAGGVIVVVLLATDSDARFGPADLLRQATGWTATLPVVPVYLASAALVALLILAADRELPVLGLLAPAAVPRQQPARSGPADRALLAIAVLVALVVAAHGFFPADWRIVELAFHALGDTFHEGEIVGGAPVLAAEGPLPVLIHGPGRNLAPAALAAAFAEPGAGIAFMRFVTGTFTALTVAALIFAGYVAAMALTEGAAVPRRRRQALALALGALGAAAALVLFGLTDRPLMFFAISGVAIHLAARAAGRGRAVRRTAALLGALLALAPLYVYSAALEAAAVAAAGGAVALWRAGPGGSAALLAYGAAGALAAALVVLLGGGGPLYLNALRDMLWWVSEGGHIWAVPPTGAAIKMMLVYVVATGTVAAFAVWRLRRGAAAPGEPLVPLVLLVMLLVASRAFWDRSDVSHVHMAMTGLAVAGPALAAALLVRVLGRPVALRAAIAATLALTTTAVPLLAAERALWTAAAGLGTPDEAVLPAGVRAFRDANQAALDDVDCLLVMSNEGVLNYVTGLPPCGGFFYPVYAATPRGDALLAERLARIDRFAAVMGAEGWSDEIDGRPMHERMPRTWALLEERLAPGPAAGDRPLRLPPD